MEHLSKIAKDNFTSIETIDVDVLSKLKQENAPFIIVLKVLTSLGISLREGQEILSRSFFYKDSYEKAADLTEEFLSFRDRARDRV